VTGAPRHSFRVLRDRDFAIFFAAALVSNSGSWMQSIAAPYVLYQLTHSTTWLGIGAFVAFFPALCVSPLAGSLADRYPRKTILFCTQTGMMITAFGLWAVWESGAATAEIIVVLLFFSGIASGLNIAAWQSFVPQLVAPADLLAAVRLNSMQFVAARAFGPALAGLVLQLYGAGTAFFLNGVSFVLVLGALLLIHARSVAVDVDAGRVMQHFREAVAYVRARAGLFVPVVTIATLSFLGSSVQQLAPAFADDVFGVGKSGYGFLISAFGMGAIVGSLVVAFWADRYLRSRVTVIGLLSFAVGELIFAATHTYAVGIAGMVVMGAAYLFVATALNTSLQARVDEAHRGRAVSIYLMGLLAGVPVGALLEGKLAEVIGLQATVVVAALGLVACSVVGMVKFEGFRPLDEALDVETGRGPDLMIDTPPTIAAAD
jgi:MFS family permease